MTNKTELNNGIANELNCIMTEHEVRLCEFALSILCDNDDEMKFSVFKTLRDKLRKLGYEYH